MERIDYSLLYLIPEQFKKLKNNVNTEKDLLDNIIPNTFNTSISLLKKFDNQPIKIGENTKETLEALNLNQVLNIIPNISLNTIEPSLLKSLLLFKGTQLDIQYLTKLAGLGRLNVVDFSVDNVYGSNILYGDKYIVYDNVDNKGLHACNFALTLDEIYINNIDNSVIIDVSFFKDILHKLLKNRTYFCSKLKFISIKLLLEDTLSKHFEEDILLTQIITTNNKINCNFKEDISLKKQIFITEKVQSNIQDSGSFHIKRHSTEGALFGDNPNHTYYFGPLNEYGEETILNYGEDDVYVDNLINF